MIDGVYPVICTVTDGVTNEVWSTVFQVVESRLYLIQKGKEHTLQLGVIPQGAMPLDLAQITPPQHPGEPFHISQKLWVVWPSKN